MSSQPLARKINVPLKVIKKSYRSSTKIVPVITIASVTALVCRLPDKSTDLTYELKNQTRQLVLVKCPLLMNQYRETESKFLQLND